MVWVKDQRNPDRPAFKVPIKTFERLQAQRKHQNYENDDYYIVDDPGYPEVLIFTSDRRYDLRKVRELKGEQANEVILNAEEAVKKEIPQRKTRTKKS